MISIICCAINAKHEATHFINFLQRYNQEYKDQFEICLALDNRVDDGSKEAFYSLSQQYDNLKIIENTHEDTADYLKQLASYYKENNIFNSYIREGLDKNIELFQSKKLFDHSKSFLWLTTGRLYNKAAKVASGDIFLVTAADFLYLFKLEDIVAYVQKYARNGLFYAKPNAVFSRISNQEPQWIDAKIQEVYDGKHREGFRWDCSELFRDYLQYPSSLNDLYLCDFIKNQKYSLGDIYAEETIQYLQNVYARKGMTIVPAFHGFHVMTRKTYDVIGGFTEEVCGRAFAEDKMQFIGSKYAYAPDKLTMPLKFSVAWITQGLVMPYLGSQHYGWEEKIKNIDPYYGKHPVLPWDKPTYLHKNIIPDNHFIELANKTFSKTTSPIRFC